MWVKQYIRFHKLTHPQEMGEELLLAGLMYCSGLRLMEALRLRVKDLDFSYRVIRVHDGKESALKT